MSVDSCIYEGTVRHRRFAPVPHEFRYRMFMVYLDLEELPRLFDRSTLWSSDRPNLAWFRREDHLGDSSESLDASVRETVKEATGRRPEGPIRLLTHLRYFGYGFNPVSFYYCYDRSERLETIVAEVNNTPWGEQHSYVLSERMNEGSGEQRRYRFGKAFHVSPFMDMDQNYDWSFRAPGNGLSVHMVTQEAGRRMLDATMVMKRTEISSAELSRVLIRYPLMTAQVIGGIYLQALKLKLKGCPFYPHPRMRDTQAEAA